MSKCWQRFHGHCYQDDHEYGSEEFSVSEEDTNDPGNVDTLTQLQTSIAVLERRLQSFERYASQPSPFVELHRALPPRELPRPFLQGHPVPCRHPTHPMDRCVLPARLC